MNIVLTGFMASGKTEISKAIARISDYNLIDTDDAIVEKMGISINEIFAKYGEEFFRKTERNVILELSNVDNTVIATGGGVVLNSENISLLRKNGIVFNLAPEFSVIEERLAEARKTRPLLKNDSIENIKKRFDDRKPFYDNCDYKINITNDRTPESYAEEILKIVKVHNEKKSITIRHIKEKDRQTVTQMMRDFYTSDAVWTDGSDEIYKADIDNCISDNPYIEGYVIENNGNIQGYGMIAKSFSTEFGKKCVWIEDIYIKDEYRGYGLGTKFLNFVEGKYPDCLLRLEVETENERAVNVYTKCGYDILPYTEMKK